VPLLHVNAFFRIGMQKSMLTVFPTEQLYNLEISSPTLKSTSITGINVTWTQHILILAQNLNLILHRHMCKFEYVYVCDCITVFIES